MNYSIDIEADTLVKPYADTVYNYTFWFSWNPTADYVERLVKTHHSYYHSSMVTGQSDEMSNPGNHYIQSMKEVATGQWVVVIVEPYLD